MEVETTNTIASPLMTLADAAGYLCAKVSTVRAMIRRGEVSFVRVGHHFCIKKSELDRWIDAHERREKPDKFGASLGQQLRKPA